jgi:hypothetical protein
MPRAKSVEGELKAKIEAFGLRFEFQKEVDFHSKINGDAGLIGTVTKKRSTHNVYTIRERPCQKYPEGRVVYRAFAADDIWRYYIRNLAPIEEKREHLNTLSR